MQGPPRRGACALTPRREPGLLCPAIAAEHDDPAGAHGQRCCGKVERFHQTLKKWLATQPRAAGINQLQHQLDAFRRYYNDIRPHRAPGRRTPAEAYAARPEAHASGIPLTDGHFRVRHDKIDTNGKLRLRHNSRLHHIGLGRQYAGTPVLVRLRDRHIRMLSTSGRLLRDLILDPSRDYQPQAPT
jgi:hypothetical protein